MYIRELGGRSATDWHEPGEPHGAGGLKSAGGARSPISRAITEEVPAHYVPQLQVLMEVLDLRAAHFVQYRPEGPFSGQEFAVTEVPRDRGWFAAALPIMRSFVVEWRALENDPEAHEKILGTRRRATRLAPEAKTAEELWAAVTSRPAGFHDRDPEEGACPDPFGEAAQAERSRVLSETVAAEECPFVADAGGCS